MKKPLIGAVGIVFIVAGCQFPAGKTNTETSLANPNLSQSDLSTWQRINLPEWDIVSFAYPSDWQHTIINKEQIEISNDTKTISVFYTADKTLTNPSSNLSTTETEVLNTYIASFKNVKSRTHSTAVLETGTEVIEVNVNGQSETHNIFFVGTLLLDVYTTTPTEPTYSKIIDSFQYGGF